MWNVLGRNPSLNFIYSQRKFRNSGYERLYSSFLFTAKKAKLQSCLISLSVIHVSAALKLPDTGPRTNWALPFGGW